MDSQPSNSDPATPSIGAIPPGWYPDPKSAGDENQRWWSGVAWTDYTAAASPSGGSTASAAMPPEPAFTIPSRRRKPVAFWWTVALAAVWVVIIVLRFVIAAHAGQLDSALLGLAIAIVIVIALIGWFALRMRARLRSAAKQLPHAFTMPVVVGPQLAGFSWFAARLSGDKRIRMFSSTYAALAFDEQGLHFIRRPGRPPGAIPASSIAFRGVGTTVVGSREMNAVGLEYSTPAATRMTYVVPLRSRGNVLRNFSEQEVSWIGEQISSALAGRPDHVREWPF